MRLLRSFALLLLLACGAVSAQDTPQLGRDYSFVDHQTPPAHTKRITVEEFFLYACPHCYAHEAPLRQWLAHKPADVDYVPVANSLGRADGMVQSRAFYIAVTLGIADKTHEAMYQAIHERHQPMSTLPAIRDLYVSAAHIKPADFDGLANSFVVDTAVNQAESLAEAYGISETPSFVAGGRYRVFASPQPARTFEVLDYVLAKLRAERGLPAPGPSPKKKK